MWNESHSILHTAVQHLSRSECENASCNIEESPIGTRVRVIRPLFMRSWGTQLEGRLLQIPITFIDKSIYIAVWLLQPIETGSVQLTMLKPW